MTVKKRKRIVGSVFRLNISYLSSAKFGRFQVLGKNVKRLAHCSPDLEALKASVLQLILAHQNHRHLQSYSIAWQTHQSNGLAHLDILLLYSKCVLKSPSSYDYLLSICPQDIGCFSQRQGAKPQVHISPYSLTRLNTAILEYGAKEDPAPLNTFTPEQSQRVLTLAAIKADPYGYLSDEMRKDPYNFDVAQYVDRYRLDKQIRCWSSIKVKLNDIRSAVLARLQLAKPGIQVITPELIASKLSVDQRATYYAYPCFQIIVDHINHIPIYGPARPHKTSNLFISGPKDIGKTALAEALAKHVGYYNLKIENKYLNRYSNNKYGFILWNQTKLTDFSHNWILQFLQGIEVPIPMRYNSCIKRDNPLVMMTSNLTLDAHIKNRYKDRLDLYITATENLGARITAVHVPVPMFFLQKLLLPVIV